MRHIVLLIAGLFFCLSAGAANINVTYSINTEVNRTPISPFIYGTNSTGNADYSVVRSGGNRLTAYNWENNYSNAGSDWYYNNDNYLCSSTVPGKAITDFRDSCISNGQDSIVTLQMADYVSADGSGQVDLATQTAPSSRFKKAVFAKGAAFCNPAGSPVTSDANVYMDEFVNFLVSRYGRAFGANGVKFYCLDNEPDLWSSTHVEVHPDQATCAEYKDKSVALSKAIKSVDPNARMLGPVSYGFNGFYSFQDAPDWDVPLSNGYDWFIDYYLDQMRASSVASGKRLLDVLDVHWYPEAQDGAGNRIISSVNTDAMYNARMQAPRSLWDSDYVENSWIGQWFSDYLPILPRLKQSINTYYPDTNLSITEYDYGGQDHWSGGIATADVLGIYGKLGVYIACYWGGGTYVDAAVRIYRNYDGNDSSFGGTEVYSAISDKVNSSIYASIVNSDACEMHLVVINKNINNAISGMFNITSPQNFISGNVWKFDNSSSDIRQAAAISTITNNSFTYTIPPTSVCHIVLHAQSEGQTEPGPEPQPEPEPNQLQLIIKKCNVTAGVTQYKDDGDYNNMKDAFEASGTAQFPQDLNDINHIDVRIISADDNFAAYSQTIGFNVSAVSKGKFKYTHKLSRGQAGGITSLLMDFNKGTFAIKAKNIDLTGLTCPVRLKFIIGNNEITGQADEDKVNGSRKTIPTRLMRMYADTLIVTKVNFRNKAKPSSDSLLVTGDIAVEDIDLDTNEPNLVTQDIIITISNIADTNVQTFVIPAGSFKTSGEKHLYKCSKVNPDITPAANANTLVTATIDLDQCKFTMKISGADLNFAPGDAKFSLSFAEFNETDNLSF